MEPTTSAHQPQFAWEPLSPSGVAAFAEARLGRLLLVQFVFALGAAVVAAWFLITAWFPVIQAAIQQMPEQSAIRSGILDWRGPAPVRLAEGGFLSIAVDPDYTGKARSPTPIYVEFGRREVRVFSLLGYLPVPYPRSVAIGFNRIDMTPWWGAWSPVMLAVTGGVVIVGLMVFWAMLATLYVGPVWLVAFYANRRCSLPQAWRLAGAAQMPGALFLCMIFVLHGMGVVDEIRVLIAWGAHFLFAWVYLWISPLHLPAVAEPILPAVNPFSPEPVEAPAPVNPFSAPGAVPDPEPNSTPPASESLAAPEPPKETPETDLESEVEPEPDDLEPPPEKDNPFRS